MQSSVLVSADYVLEVELDTFRNPSNRRFNGQCCDQVNSTDCTNEPERCDTYFIYCLRRFNTTNINCPNGTVLTSDNAINSNFINFSRPTALGLPNPFNLPGLSLFWQVIEYKFKQHNFMCTKYHFKLFFIFRVFNSILKCMISIMN